MTAPPLPVEPLPGNSPRASEEGKVLTTTSRLWCRPAATTQNVAADNHRTAHSPPNESAERR